MPCGTIPTRSLNRASDPFGPPVPAIGINDIISTPPATTRSACPAITCDAAALTASSPDEQNRLTV